MRIKSSGELVMSVLGPMRVTEPAKHQNVIIDMCLEAAQD